MDCYRSYAWTARRTLGALTLTVRVLITGAGSFKLSALLAFKVGTAMNNSEDTAKPGDKIEKKTRRVQMDLPAKSYDRIERLKETTEASSYAEVVKNAIRLYEYLVEQDSKGCKFYVENNEERTSVALFSGSP